VTGLVRRLLAVAVGICAVLAVWVYAYNSGLGYDGLEFLVIGRALRDGIPFYTFAPSKSFGLYYLAAGFLAIPGADSRIGIAGLVTFLLVFVSVVTFAVMKRRVGAQMGFAAVALTAMAAAFMELNYLLPEGLVFVCGLAAFALVTRPVDAGASRSWVAAGAAIGIGMCFKIVAACYAVGVIAWLFLVGRHRAANEPPVGRRAALFLAGVAIVLMTSAAYFWSTGRLGPHVEWTYRFPVLDYPHRAEWLPKLYTKLLWVWLVIGSAMVLSTAPRLRGVVYADSHGLLLLLMGAAGLLPLLRSQASHFAFPGTALLLLFAVVVMQAWRETNPRVSGMLPALLAATACLVSAVVYQPEGIHRLLGMRSYAQVDRLGEAAAALVPAGSRAIFFGEGLPLYWASGRYPTWPMLHTDVQAAHLVANDGHQLLAALDDPRLVLVEFNPRARHFNDVAFFDGPRGRAFIESFHARLQAGWRRDDVLLAPLVIWVRTSHAARG
jgi:hypothetical protein